MWLLGSSPQSAIWAAQLALPYAFADFINPGGEEIARVYRERFEAVERELVGAAHGGRRLGPVRRHRRGGAATGGEQPDDADAAAPRAS